MRAGLGGSRTTRRRSVSIGLLASVILAACSTPGASPSSAAAATTAPEPAPAATIAPVPTPSATTSGGGRGDYDYPDPAGSGSPASSEPNAVEGLVPVNIATGPLGDYLTGLDGLTLYTFKPDGANTSTCNAGCAEAWPPFTVAADATLEGGDGVDGDLTTFARADGSLQVSYDGAPLYYFANDTSAGDTKGQGLGDNWFVAKP